MGGVPFPTTPRADQRAPVAHGPQSVGRRRLESPPLLAVPPLAAMASLPQGHRSLLTRLHPFAIRRIVPILVPALKLASDLVSTTRWVRLQPGSR